MVIQSHTLYISRRLMLSIALLILGATVAVFFGVRAYRAYNRFHPQAPTTGMTDVETIRGWMTLPYIARAYGVPEDALFTALGIPKSGNERLSVKQLVTKYGREPQAAREAIQQVLLLHLGTPEPVGAP